jgi:hypothetical protein
MFVDVTWSVCFRIWRLDALLGVGGGGSDYFADLTLCSEDSISSSESIYGELESLLAKSGVVKNGLLKRECISFVHFL